MRPAPWLLCWVSLSIPMCASGAPDFTGIWKADCSDYYGIQIKPAENQLYSVSFCGLRGCFEPGTWTPNTRIEGDPKYKVISPTELGIRKRDSDEYFMYVKCASDPTWAAAKPPETVSKQEPKPSLDCSFAAASKEDWVVIAWITDIRKTTQWGSGGKTQTTIVGPFRAVAILDGSLIKETAGAGIHRGQQFWRILSPKSAPVRVGAVDSFLDHMGEDHCVYFGSLENAGVPRWTLLSSKPLPGVFRTPTAKDHAEFRRLNTSCVQQGDYPEGKAPPCVRPRLLAISDINKNAKPEYWATEPYRWDTGLTVWENDTRTLTRLLEVCPGCSD